jgi:hypothetical protein
LISPQVTTNPATDVLPIVNIADTLMASSGSTRKITVNQLLGAGGTATLASATITGDLTVDTSTLKVDSTNDRVGFGTASPAQGVHLSKSSTSTALTSPPVGGASFRIQNTSSTNNNFGSVEFYNAAGLFGASVNCQYTNQATPTSDLVFVTRGTLGGLEHYRIAADGVATWSEVGGVAGTAMTLNATGLGVGAATPDFKFVVNGTQAVPSTSGSSATDGSLRIGAPGTGLVIDTGVTAASAVYGWIQARAKTDYSSNFNLVLQPNGGNVGVGVTPAGTGGCLQLKSGITFPATQVASSDANTLDDYEEGTFTPTIIGTSAAGTGTYTTQLGNYTKVGRIVTCDISLVWTAHTGTGNIDIGGLPFSVLTTSGYSASAVIGYIENVALTAGNIPIAVLWWFNTTKIRLNQSPTGGGAAAGIPMDTAGQINLSITYIVA